MVIANFKEIMGMFTNTYGAVMPPKCLSGGVFMM